MKLKFALRNEKKAEDTALDVIVNEKTWTNQRSKRRRKMLNTPLVEENEPNEQISFEFEFKLLRKSEISFSFEFNLVSFDETNKSNLSELKDSLNQILQFLKNKLIELKKEEKSKLSSLSEKN
jgi:hypothetical protein